MVTGAVSVWADSEQEILCGVTRLMDQRACA